MKRYFDAIVVVPLEEEFEVVLDSFHVTDDLSTTTQIRFAATPPGQRITVLLVKQFKMGRTECQEAITLSLDEFDCGIAICVGIAGALSSDLSIGDVCYSTSIMDVLDNTKISDRPDRSQTIQIAPDFYDTPRELVVPISLDRISPRTKADYSAWAEGLGKAGAQLIPGSFSGKDGKPETIKPPHVLPGVIACGPVSASPAFNAQLKLAHRKVLAIETESGGLFVVARRVGVPAITVRGISDYAGIDKNRFEEETGNKARLLAATNAASFLVRQLSSSGLSNYLDSLRQGRAGGDAQLPFPKPESDPAALLIRQGQGFDDKLRDLAPAHALQSKGYRLPVPRIRIMELSPAQAEEPNPPVEVRDALRETRVIILHVPREYPDRSLSWIIATDLISAQIGETQLVPSVVEANQLQRPRFGILKLVDPEILKIAESPEFICVFIVDDFDFGSKSRTDFLQEQIEASPNGKFVIVTRSSESVVASQNFPNKVAASTARLCDVSFREIATFIRKNFEMEPSASEVVAARLTETFKRYALPAHPSYFAGIPRNTLIALLQANQRAELIEIAVMGYLSFVVAGDTQTIALGRTTRERFLSDLVHAMASEKRSFTEAELTTYAHSFAKRFDFNISANRFVLSFIDNHILHVEDDVIRFTLPFMEAYLLAKRLLENPADANKYFSRLYEEFDYQTFSLYAEMGAEQSVIDNIVSELDAVIADLQGEAPLGAILMDAAVYPRALDRMARLQSAQKLLHKAAADVRSGQDQSHEKQLILDASDHMREMAAAQASSRDLPKTEVAASQKAVTLWSVALNLLGSGAERLEAETKRNLVKKVVKLSGLIIDDMTRKTIAVDFSEIKEKMSQDKGLMEALVRSNPGLNPNEAKSAIGNLVDFTELAIVVQPFLATMASLCDEARAHVLAESIGHSEVDQGIDRLIRNLWLSDIDVPSGRGSLNQSIKDLPNAKLLRHAVMAHLMMRVFWKHWVKGDRLSLLDSADLSLRSLGVQYKTGELTRIVERLKETEELNE